MPIDFPNSPTNGDSFTSNDKTWQFNGSSWTLVAGTASLDNASVTAAKLAANAVTSEKIAAGAVTANKLGNDIQLTPPDGSITTAKIAPNAVTQAKLAANVSAVTVTTTANRGTDVPSPFTGQLVFLTDVTRMQVWNGSEWKFITNGAPGAPTGLSATALSTTSISVAFTAGESAGLSPINYKYSLSTNGGSTYGEPTALDPADVVSPVTISGLTGGQTYHVKLRAVSDFGDSPDSTATSVAVPALPSAPTSLSATPLSTTSVSVAFTPGADGGSAITNYQYATSTNGGSTYSSFTALSPADATSPIEITGLTEGTAYLVKLKAVHAFGAGAESAAVSFTLTMNVQVTLLGGGGGGGTGNGQWASGGSGGGYLEANFTITPSTNYSTTVGSAGPGQTVCNNSDHRTIGKGGNSIFSTASAGGGQGGNNNTQAAGIGGTNTTTGSSSVIVNYAGETSIHPTGESNAGGHNGLRNIGLLATYGSGASGVSNGSPGTHATGNGNGGAGGPSCQGGHRGGGNGSIGIVILTYSNVKTITLGAGLTGSTTTVSSNKVTTITAGSGNVSWA